MSLSFQAKPYNSREGRVMKEMLTNKILTGLPDEEFVRLMPLLEPVSLYVGQCLVHAGEVQHFVYFPESAIVSSHAYMQDGKSAEVGMVGKDGVTGLPALLGSHIAAQSLDVTIAGSALKMRKEDFDEELQRSESLRQALLNYAGDYITQVSQRSACAILHRMEQRLAVWLLMLTDRLGGDAIEITQERISQHLGVRRAGITVVAGELQDRGAIRYTRGNLRVVNRSALELSACECYAAMTQHGQNRAWV